MIQSKGTELCGDNISEHSYKERCGSINRRRKNETGANERIQ